MKEDMFILGTILCLLCLGCSGCSEPKEPDPPPCPDCQPKPEPNLPKNFTWKPLNGNQDELFLDGKKVGAYDYPSHSFTEFVGEKWGRTGLSCPVECPVRIDKLPTGVNLGGIQQTGEHFKLEGKEVQRDEALKLFQGPCPNCPKPPVNPLPDGKGPYLTVVSRDPVMRERIRDWWFSDPRTAAHRETVALWVVDPGHWSLDVGHVREDGSITFQDANGGVLHRQSSLDFGSLIEALRKKNPNYDPRKDPDASRPIRGFFSGVSEMLIGACVAFFAFVVLLVVFGYLIGRR